MKWNEIKANELRGKSGIYKFAAGGHIYVGSSKNLYGRITEHKADLINQKHANPFFQKVFNKYGRDNFEIEILEYCLPDERIEKESAWIKELNADINLTDPLTHKLSPESIEKLKASEKKGRSEGKYKTKYDKCTIECYDYFGDKIKTFQNKEEAAKELNTTIKIIEQLASGYKKGMSRYGIRLRYSISEVPVQKFDVNPQYLGKYYDFYYLDDNKKEQFAFHDVRDLYPFIAEQLRNKKSQITIIPKLKTL